MTEVEGLMEIRKLRLDQVQILSHPSISGKANL